MLAAGVTLFAAVKISETSAATPGARWLVALFQTAIVLAAFAWFRCYGNAQLDLDLLNRYLPTEEGGTWFGTMAPLCAHMDLGNAESVVRAHEPTLKSPWPAKGDSAFYLMAMSGVLATVLLLLYLWWPIMGPATASPAKPPAPPPVVVSSIGVLVTVHFDKDRAEVPIDAARRLEPLARVVAPRPSECVRVEGHADRDGRGEYNLDLSRRRTDAVVALLNDAGIPRQRMEAIPYGITRPSAIGNTDSAKAENRRVDVLIISCH